jgi:hypothetical protein
MMGSIEGLHVGMRNPVTSYSEVAKIKMIKDTCKYTQHLKYIIQFGSGLFMSRMNMDFDGDKLCLFPTERDYKQTTIRFLQHLKSKKVTIDDTEVDSLIYTDICLKDHLNRISPTGKITIAILL